MQEIFVPTERGTVLNGVLFDTENADLSLALTTISLAATPPNF